MRGPRVRFSLRQLMAGVAILGVILASERGRQQCAFCHSRADYHRHHFMNQSPARTNAAQK